MKAFKMVLPFLICIFGFGFALGQTTSIIVTTPSTCTLTCVPNGTPPTTANVTVSPATQSYVTGSGAAVPTISWSSTSSGVACTLTDAAGFTHTTTGNTWVLSTPVSVGTFSFPVTCSWSGGPVIISPTSATLVVSSSSGGTCSASQSSTSLSGVILQRQCSGNVTYSGGRFGGAGTIYRNGYNGPLSQLGVVLPQTPAATVPGTWGTYGSGFSMTPTITSGYYIALAFTTTSSGSIQFTTDDSFGVGGIISLSTQPGGLTPGAAGVICSYGRGASNSLYAVLTPGANCAVSAGQTYYINMTNTLLDGTQSCYNGSPTCSSTTVSYSAIVGR